MCVYTCVYVSSYNNKKTKVKYKICLLTNHGIY